MALAITPHDPRLPEVVHLLQRHLEFARAVTPPGHVHALDLEGLLEPEVSFFGARRGGVLLGIGALKELDAGHVELKSMHTAADARGEGVGSAMLSYLMAIATERGYRRVSLETGTMPAFMPARSLYERFGFKPCEPFGRYTVNPNSICMTIELPYAAS